MPEAHAQPRLCRAETLLSLVAFVGGAESDGVAYDDDDATTRGRLLVWFQGVATILVIVIAAVVHFKTAPFRYDFQNRLELGLFVSDALLIALCLCSPSR